MPVVQSSLAGTDVWIVMRQWKALVDFHKQLRCSGPGKRAASNHKQPKPADSLKRALESELVKVAGADASKHALGVDSINSWNAPVATPLSPEGVASLSASRTESHAVLERFRQTTNVRRAQSGRKSTLGTASSGSYRLMRSCWQAWRDYRYAAAVQQLAFDTSPASRITEGVDSPRKAPVVISDTSNRSPPVEAQPISHTSNRSPSVDTKMISHASGTLSSAKTRTTTTRQEKSTDCDLAAEDWALVAENLRRHGRRRAPDFKLKANAHFLMNRARLRRNSGANAKLFVKQSGDRSEQ